MLVVLNIKEAALHDGFMPASCCSLKSDKIQNAIGVWTKGSSRSSCTTPKRPLHDGVVPMISQRGNEITNQISLEPRIVEFVVLNTK